jgi:hypothetical protein
LAEVLGKREVVGGGALCVLVAVLLANRRDHLSLRRGVRNRESLGGCVGRSHIQRRAAGEQQHQCEEYKRARAVHEAISA